VNLIKRNKRQRERMKIVKGHDRKKESIVNGDKQMIAGGGCDMQNKKLFTNERQGRTTRIVGIKISCDI